MTWISKADLSNSALHSQKNVDFDYEPEFWVFLPRIQRKTTQNSGYEDKFLVFYRGKRLLTIVVDAAKDHRKLNCLSTRLKQRLL